MLYLNKVIEERKDLVEKIKTGKLVLPMDPLLIPCTYITVPFEYHDEHHRAGFVFNVNQKDFTVISCSWFRADGEGTYRESPIPAEELKTIMVFFDLHKIDLWAKFCACVIDPAIETK